MALIEPRALRRVDPEVAATHRRTVTTSSFVARAGHEAKAPCRFGRCRCAAASRSTTFSSPKRAGGRHLQSPSRTKAPACASSVGLAAMRRFAPLALVLTLAVVGHRARRHLRRRAVGAVRAPGGLTPNPSLSVPNSLSTPPVAPVQLSYADSSRCGSGPARRTASPWQVLAAINKVESNWGRTWGRARRARSAGCSSCRARGFAGASTRTATASPIPGTQPMQSSLPPAISPRRAAQPISIAAVYAYNHPDWYVKQVLSLADLYGGNSTFAYSRSIACSRTRRCASRRGSHRRARDRSREGCAQRSARRARWQARAAKATLLPTASCWNSAPVRRRAS